MKKVQEIKKIWTDMGKNKRIKQFVKVHKRTVRKFYKDCYTLRCIAEKKNLQGDVPFFIWNYEGF